MSPKLDLYNNAYGNYESDAYREVRIETYGEDLGQTSWVTTEESAGIPELLALERDSYVLEVGCGSGSTNPVSATPTSSRNPEASLHWRFSSKLTLRKISLSTKRLSMPHSQTMFCATFPAGSASSPKSSAS